MHDTYSWALKIIETSRVYTLNAYNGALKVIKISTVYKLNAHIVTVWLRVYIYIFFYFEKTST